MPSVRPLWYAAYTRSRAEKKVAFALAEEKITHYLPLRLIMRQWSDRKKLIEVPLIRSYIFVNITPQDHLRTLLVPGIVKILHFCGKPVPIPEWQIKNLKILLSLRVPMDIGYKELVKGKEVRIFRGPLTGMRGTVVMVKGQHKLVIGISALDYNLTIDIDPESLEAIV